MVRKKLPLGTVLKLGNSKKRHLKIPNEQFYELSHGDTAVVLQRETNDYTELIYRFKKEDLIKTELINAELIRAEQKLIKQEIAELIKVELIRAEQEIVEQIKDKLIKEELITCEFCSNPLNERHVKLINVAHNPNVICFCSRDCKFNWIYRRQQNNF